MPDSPRLEPSARLVLALAAQARFAGYARLYAALVFLAPGLSLLATPLRNTDTETFYPAGDAILYGRGGGTFLVLALGLFTAVLVAGAFNPVRTGIGSAAAVGGLVMSGLTALAAVSENQLSAGGWAILLTGVSCLALGVTHELHLARARRQGLGG